MSGDFNELEKELVIELSNFKGKREEIALEVYDIIKDHLNHPEINGIGISDYQKIIDKIINSKGKYPEIPLNCAENLKK